MHDNLFDAMREHGFIIESFPVYGVVTRFATSKVKEKTGWVYPFDDGKGASFGDWLTGEKHDWFLGGETEKLTAEQKMQRDEQRWIARTKAENERNAEYKRAAIEAQTIWENALPCDRHAYFDKKGIAPVGNFRIDADNRLIIPVYDKDQNIQSLQFITHDGNKQFLTGGKIKGGCFVIGQIEIGKDALLCEGLATGYSVNLATDLPVIVAFSASNLAAVYESFKPHCNIKIAADNDKSGAGIKGAQKCEGAHIFVPPLINDKSTDFNDLHKEQGIDAVKSIFNVKNESLFISVGELMAMDFRTNWLIKGFIEKGGLGMIYGDSGSGKSLFVLDWAFCLATGRNWHGFRVKESAKVLYVAGEGGRGFKMRLAALQQKYNSKITKGIAFSKQSFNFLDEKSALTIIDDVENETVKPDLIVIDTLNRNIIGDENKADDMGKFFATIEILVKKYNCAVLVVHHSGVSDKGRSRGSSATPAGMDFVFCVTKSNDYETSITCTKMKDADKPPPLKFIITKTDLQGEEWHDEDENKQITGVYLAYQGVDTEKEQKLSERDELALNALKMAIKESPKKNHGVVGDCVALGAPIGIMMADLENFKVYFKGTCKGKNWVRDFDNSLKSLTNRRYIGRDGNYLWLIEE